MKLPTLALIEITLLWVAILVTIIKFYRINREAAYLLLPYLIWTTFASTLNLAIVILN